MVPSSICRLYADMWSTPQWNCLYQCSLCQIQIFDPVNQKLNPHQIFYSNFSTQICILSLPSASLCNRPNSPIHHHQVELPYANYLFRIFIRYIFLSQEFGFGFYDLFHIFMHIVMQFYFLTIFQYNLHQLRVHL